MFINQLFRCKNHLTQGNIYQKAIEIARSNFPNQVVIHEEAFRDYLLTLNQIDMAIEHFIQSLSFEKAIDAAMNHSRLSKAEAMLADAGFREAFSISYYDKLASYAEKCSLKITKYEQIVAIHVNADLWGKALLVASCHLSEKDITNLQRQQVILEAKSQN